MSGAGPHAVEIQYRCPACAAVISLEGWPAGDSLRCPECEGCLPLSADARPDMQRILGKCPVCGGEEFYVQRDFNRRVGLALVILGALLAWPTRGWSLVAVVLLDLALYAVVPEIAICYRCEAIFRGLRRNPAHGAFSLATEEKYRVIRAHDAEMRAREASAGGKPLPAPGRPAPSASAR